MFERILVPLDGSEDGWIALEQAIKVAKAEENNGRVKGLFVLDIKLIEDPYYLATDPYDLVPKGGPDVVQLLLELEKRLNELGEAVLARAAERCGRAGVAFEGELARGLVPRVILERAQGHDLIVMGRHGAGGKRAGPLLGSTFEAVVRRAPVPVLAPHFETSPMKRLLLAYDGSEPAQKALHIAAHWAQRHEAVVVLLTVDDGGGRAHDAYAEGKAKLEALGVSFDPLMRAGHPAEIVLEVAQEEACDLIALGAYGHRRFLEIFFGGTVEEVVRHAPQAVLIAR